MYRCEKCSKNYTSSRRYESHSARCGLQSKSQTPISSRLDSLTDPERSTSRSIRSTLSKQSQSRPDPDYDKKVKKLEKDKEKLKRKLIKYSDELKRRVSGSREIQSRLDMLTDERDQLIYELEQQTQKKKSNNSTVKQLEKTIISLRERLTVQQQKHDQSMDVAKSHFTSHEKKLKEEIGELNNKVSLLSNELEQEKKVISQLRDSYKSERVNMRKSYDQEKQQELNNILSEKHRIISTLEHKLHDALETIEQNRKKHELELRQVHLNIYNDRERNDREVTKIKASLGDAIERERQQMQDRLSNIQNKHAKAINELKQQHAKELKLINDNSEKVRQQALNAVTNRDTALETLKHEYKLELQKLEEKYKEREKNHEKNLSNQLADYKHDLHSQFEEKEKTIQLKADARVEESSCRLGEMTDRYEKLRQDAEHLKTMVGRLKESNKTINQQFIHNLNKQNKTNTQIVQEKDKRINELERELKKITVQVSNKLEQKEQDILTSHQKIAELSQVNTKLLSDLNAVKIEEKQIENLQSTIETIKKEFVTKLQQESDKVMSVTHSMMEIKAQLESERNRNNLLYKENSFLRKQLIDKVRELTKEFNNEVSGLQEKLEKKDEDIKNLENQIRSQRSTVMQELTTSRSRISSLSTELDNVNNKLREQVRENKDKTILVSQLTEELKGIADSHKDEMQGLNKQISTVAEEKNILLIQLTKAHAAIDHIKTQTEKLKKNFLENINNESTKYVDLHRLYEKSEETIKDLKNDIYSLKEQLNMSKVENAKLTDVDKRCKEIKRDYDKLTLQNKDYESRISSLIDKVRSLTSSADTAREYKERCEKQTEMLHKMKKDMLVPKVDMNIKKSRDEALLMLRRQKKEIEKLTAKNAQLMDDIKQRDQILSSKSNEMTTMSTSHDDIKANFIKTLNEQSESHREELAMRDKRIRELEELMMHKIREN